MQGRDTGSKVREARITSGSLLCEDDPAGACRNYKLAELSSLDMPAGCDFERAWRTSGTSESSVLKRRMHSSRSPCSSLSLIRNSG